MFLFLCTSYSAQSQLAGVYEYRDSADWIVVTLTLTPNNTFVWRSCNGYGDVIASGKYSSTDSKLTLSPEKAYRFYGDDYRLLISKLILDSCCNAKIVQGGKTVTEYKQTFYNLQSRADSCILNNMSCILSSGQLDRARKHFKFRDTFIFTELKIRDDETVIFENKEIKWILKQRRGERQ